MSYAWFQNVLEALGKRLNYESISNLYGNSFAKDAAKIIQSANPLIKINQAGNTANALIGLSGKMTIIKSGNEKAQKEQMQKALGDTSWFDEYIK